MNHTRDLAPITTSGFFALILLVSVSGSSLAPPANNTRNSVSFYHQIKPILQTRCQGCHQPNVRSGHLMLISYGDFLKGGAFGPGFVKGHPEKSLVMGYLHGTPELMPQGGPALSAAQIALFQRWIAEGAPDDTPAEHSAYSSSHPPVYNSPPVITALAYSPDGKTLACAAYHETVLINTETDAIRARLIGDSQKITSLAFSTNGKMLAVVGGTPARFGEIEIWDPDTDKLLNRFRLTYDTLFGGSFSKDGSHISVGCADNSVRVLDAATGRQIMKLDNHSDWVFGTFFSRDGKYVVSGGRDEALKLTEVNTGSFIDDINTHTSSILSLVRRPGQDQALIGGGDGIPRLYQVFRTAARTMNQEDHNLIHEYERQPGIISDLAFQPGGSLFAVSTVLGSVRLYDTDSGKKALHLPRVPDAVFALAFSPDGKLLATAGIDGHVRIYNIPSGSLSKSFVPVPMSKVTQTALKTNEAEEEE